MKKTVLIVALLVLTAAASIAEETKDGAERAIASAEYNIEQMAAAGFTVTKINATLAEAQKAFRDRYYGQAVQLSARVESARAEAFSTYSLIQNARDKISENSNAGFDVKYARDVLALSQAEFDKENYGEAAKLTGDALLANQQASPIIRKTVVNRIKQNWKGILAALIIIAAAAYISYPKILKKLYKNKIQSLGKELESIKNQMKELEERRYLKKNISAEEYDKTRAQKEKRIADIGKETALTQKKISWLSEGKTTP